MRVAIWSTIFIAAVASATMASSAFNYASATRAISVAVVGDDAAYLRVEERAGPHECFVDTVDSVIVISFESAIGCDPAATGTGINAGDGSNTARYSRYAFHDLLRITNKAPSALHLWINSSSTTSASAQSAVEAAVATATGQMTNANYGTAITLPASSFAIGTTVYVGVAVKSGTLSGGTLTGSIQVEARA